MITVADRAAAGGLLEEPADKLDPVSARSYHHPALGDRTVVRLCSEGLAPGEDLTLEFYGFGAPEARRVGWQLPKGLGFPAWALIHDPARAAFALAVVKEFRGHARAARSRPGHAKDGLDAIGTRLGRSVPHFLPSFYEECGRVFLETSNTNYAAQYFNKAREAEKVHALSIDEELRRQCFLEFALAGAVPVKALTEYARELERAHEPKVAFEHFRELCLRRTLGGMPPWASMMKDLARLSKAAGLDVGREEQTFLKEVLASASLARSPIELWLSAKASLKSLCSEAEVRGILLNLFPKFSGDVLKQAETWFELLDHWGVTAGLTEPAGLGPDQPEGGAAAWLSRMNHHFRTYRNSNPDALFALTRSMAARLKADGMPVDLRPSATWLDIDFLEQLAALQIPMTLSPGPARPGLSTRIWSTGTGPERPKDPIHASRDPLLAPLFVETLDGMMGTEPFETLSSSMQGWRESRRRWLERKLDQLEREALPSLRQILDRLEKIDNGQLFGPYSELYARFLRLQVGPILVRSLRGALASELVWPALEEAMTELSPDGKAEVKLDGLFPQLVAWAGGRALAVGPEAIVARHDLVVPAGAKIESVLFVGGQFLVRHAQGAKRHGYWSGDPGQSWEHSTYHQSMLHATTATLPDGGVTFGRRALHAGDKEMPEAGSLLCDGTTYWRLEYHDNRWRAREFDPRTGADGRFSLPTFLEDYVEADWQLELRECSLFPGKSQTELLGYRVRTRKGEIEIESVDGRRWAGSERKGARPVGLLRLPGSHEDRLIGRGGYGIYGNSSLWDPTNSYAVATPQDHRTASLWKVPPHWWHLLQPRDPAASTILRQLPDEAGEALLKGQPLAGIGRLQSGLSQVVSNALALQERLQKFLAQRNPGTAPTEPVLIYQLAGLLNRLGFSVSPSERTDLSLELNAIELLAGPPAESGGLLRKLGRMAGVIAAPAAVKIEPIALSLAQRVPGQLAALAWLAVAPHTAAAERSKMVQLLELWARSPVVKQPQLFRKVELKLESKVNALVLQQGKSQFLLSRPDYGRHNFSGLEYAPDATFRVPAGAELVSAHPLVDTPWDTSERLQRFVQLARARGERPFSRIEVEEVARATGLSYAESCFIWCGMPFLQIYEVNFLPSAVRELWGLKMAEAKVAKTSLAAAFPAAARLRLYSEAMPEDPAQLWDTPQAAAERLALAWNRLVGRRREISPEMLADLTALKAPVKPDAMLKTLANPNDSPLARDGRWKLNDNGNPEAPGEVFSDAHLLTTVTYACHVLQSAPVGDPLRAQLAEALARVAQRLRNPDLILLLGRQYGLDEAQKANWLQAVGGQSITGGRDNGRVMVIDARYCMTFYYRPGRIADPANEAVLNAMPDRTWTAVGLMHRSSFQELVERLASTPLAEGQYEANPLLSAPALTDEVQAALDLDARAAALYLQTLTLAEPTKAQVCLWNGWSADVYRKAATALVSKGLLLEAKRARAGRSHFLPGGWEDLKSPHLPLETWKLPLYEIKRVATAVTVPLGRILPLLPLHRLFEAAWGTSQVGR